MNISVSIYNSKETHCRHYFAVGATKHRILNYLIYKNMFMAEEMAPITPYIMLTLL